MRFTSLSLVLLITFSCSSKVILTRNADTLLTYQIQKRLPLYSDQKEQLSKDVKNFLNDQKPTAKKILPILDTLEFDVGQVDKQYDHLKELYTDVALKFSKLMSVYMSRLDEKQQKDFINTLKSENDSLALSPLDDRMEKIQDRFETMFGSVTNKQKMILDEQRPYFVERHNLRLNRRENLRIRFMEIYKMDISKEARANYFYAAFEEYQQSYPDSPKNREMIKQIIPTLGPEQKKTFKKKTTELKEILNYYLELHY